MTDKETKTDHEVAPAAGQTDAQPKRNALLEHAQAAGDRLSSSLGNAYEGAKQRLPFSSRNDVPPSYDFPDAPPLAPTEFPPLQFPLQQALDNPITEIEAVLKKAEHGMGRHKSSITNDITFSHFPASTGLHKGTLFFPAFETPFPAYNPLDFWLNRRKLTGATPKVTVHRRKGIVLKGHDLRLSVHIVFAPLLPEAGALSALCTFKASRKCMFGAAKIRLDKIASIGSCTLFNWPSTPMLYCSDPVPIPTGWAPTSHMNSVRFHMTFADWLAGALEIFVEMVISGLFSLVSAGGSSSKAKDIFFDEISLKSILLENAKENVTSLYKGCINAALVEEADLGSEQRTVEWSLTLDVVGVRRGSFDVMEHYHGNEKVSTEASLEIYKPEPKRNYNAELINTPLPPPFGVLPNLRTWGDVI